MFIESVQRFEARCKDIRFKQCEVCKCTGISLCLKKYKNYGLVCVDCKCELQRNNLIEDIQLQQPVWINKDQQIHFELPEELSRLTEGEKLLLQQCAVYVPFQHLKNGQMGSKGHCCCFPVDLGHVVKELPLKEAKFVNVIHTIKSDSPGLSKKLSFTVNRKKFLMH